MQTANIESRIARVRDTISAAAARVGRDPGKVTVVAVTKGHPAEVVQAALDAGIEDIGENRVEELEEKVERIGRHACRWHMVGHVQRRKAPQVLELADILHSLGSVRLAERFERVFPEDGRDPFPVLVQVNTSGEESKGGFEPEGILGELEAILALPSLRVQGLMTMAPLTDDEVVLRRAFGRLREVHRSALTLPGYSGQELSMGMSNDYAIAVEEGSTMVRLGTALLGERPR